jgi:hypothetical protein
MVIDFTSRLAANIVKEKTQMIESKLMEIYLERCKKEPEFKQELLDTVSRLEVILKDIRIAIVKVNN